MIIVFLISLITCSLDLETALTFTHSHFKCFFFFAVYIVTGRMYFHHIFGNSREVVKWWVLGWYQYR